MPSPVQGRALHMRISRGITPPSPYLAMLRSVIRNVRILRPRDHATKSIFGDASESPSIMVRIVMYINIYICMAHSFTLNVQKNGTESRYQPHVFDIAWVGEVTLEL